MRVNIVLDIDLALDLILKRGDLFPEKLALYEFIKKANYQICFAVCAIPKLEEDYNFEVKHSHKNKLNSFLKSLTIISTPGSAWEEISEKHPNHLNALISLSTANLPGRSIIWRGDRDFQSCCPEVCVMDHGQLKLFFQQKSNQTEHTFVDLVTQQMVLRSSLEKNIFSVLKHGKYVMGPEVKELEQNLAKFVGVKHCIGCASGTDALLMALIAMDIGPGDAIFTTPFTFIATAEVISLLGAIPVFVDIDETFNIDPEKLIEAIKALKTKSPLVYPIPLNIVNEKSIINPKGIITVDLFGLPCDYDKIKAIASSEGIFIIEDAAQSFGGEYKEEKTCSLTEIGCTSFFPSKPLGCYGDGGAVFTDNDSIAERLSSIRVHGKGAHKYDNICIGLNARLDTLQAAILLSKLEGYSKEQDLRKKIAENYSSLLMDLNVGVKIPNVPQERRSAWAQYSVLAKNTNTRTKIQKFLKKVEIPTAIYYPTPLHLQTAFASLGYNKGDFPMSEDASQRIFSLPMHPYLEDLEVAKVCHSIDMALSSESERNISNFDFSKKN